MLSYGGDLAGWQKGGAGAIHAVNLDYASDYAVMFWHDNYIILAEGIPANTSGVAYRVEFLAGPAVYANPSQATSGADGLVVEVLRADDSVLTTFTCQPGAWTGTMSLTPFSFEYVGDGSGPVRLRISPLRPGNGHFSGAIDNLAVTDLGAASVPSILVQPSGGTVVEGDDFALSVVAKLANSYQWLKSGEPIPGATNSTYKLTNVKTSDAGTYAVVVSNPVGSVNSTAAVLTVTPAPTYASYFEAVLADKPVHYYPLQDTNLPVAIDLGSLATTNAAYNGGITLEPAPGVGPFARYATLDGQPGTYVAASPFHPETSVTIEVWVWLDPAAAGRLTGSWIDVVSQTGPAWGGVAYNLGFIPGGRVELAVVNDSGADARGTTAGPVPAGAWHHLVGIFDAAAGTVTVFVDGLQGSVGALAGLIPSNVPDTVPDWMLIGASRDGSNNSFNFMGHIAQVAVYDRPLSPVQIRAHYKAATQGAAPSLAIENAVIVSWPSFPAGYVLQVATNVDGPYTDYVGAIYTAPEGLIAPVPTRSTRQYFRLIKP